VIVPGGAATKRGQFYAVGIVGKRELGGMSISRGYAYDGWPLGLGDDVESGPGGGEGNRRILSLGDPAAGAEFTSQTVPTNALWKARGFSCIDGLVTDATAGNRVLEVRLSDGAAFYAGENPTRCRRPRRAPSSVASA
jgi:hypothetical protein